MSNAKSPRVLITSRLYGAGGVETHLLNLCRVLVDHGAEVTLATRFARPDTPLLQVSREIPIRIMATPFASDLRWFRASTAWALITWPYLLDGGFDVLYTLEVSKFTHFLAHFVRQDGFVIGNRAGEPLKDNQSLPDQTAALDGLIVESSVQAETARRALPAGVPVKAIPHLGYTSQPPPRSRKPTERLRIAYLGRYDRAKGIYRLLDLWPDLDITPARLDYYGHGVEAENLRRTIND